MRCAWILPALLSFIFVGCRALPFHPPRAQPPPRAATYREASDYTMARWYGFRAAACSLTFDDGTLDQYLLAFPELERRNLKATFFLITGPRSSGLWDDSGRPRQLLGWPHAREISLAGHEVASHSIRHLDLSLAGAPVPSELRGSLQDLTREVAVQDGAVFGWPYWRSSRSGRRHARRIYVAARSGTASVDSFLAGGIPGATPADLFDVAALGLLADADVENWQVVLEQGLAVGGWIIPNFHGIDDGWVGDAALGWQPLSLELFRSVLDYLVRQDLWIAPFGRVARYVRERDSARLLVVAEEPYELHYRLVDGYEDSVYDQALTLRLRLPDGWEAVEVRQDGQRMKSDVVRGLLTFDGRPDGRSISVRRVR